jgi:hypothetical protein
MKNKNITLKHYRHRTSTLYVDAAGSIRNNEEAEVMRMCRRAWRVYLVVILIMVAIAAAAQPKKNWWKYTSLVSAGLIAGVADGQREAIQHNKWAYRYRHPNANENWWNPDSTWKRANGATQAGGTLFAFTKDKYHLNGAIRTTMFSIQMGLVSRLTLDEFKKHGKFKPLKLLLHIAIAQASYMLGKGITHRYYDVW